MSDYEVVVPPVRTCPTCGARGTLAHRETDVIECDPVRSDRVDTDRGGCGDRFRVDFDGSATEQAELAAQVEELRAELSALREEREAEAEAEATEG